MLVLLDGRLNCIFLFEGQLFFAQTLAQLINFFSKRLDLIPHLRQSTKMRVHLFILCERLYWNSPPDTWTHYLARQYSSFRSNYCPTLYSRVITESDLPTNH